MQINWKLKRFYLSLLDEEKGICQQNGIKEYKMNHINHRIGNSPENGSIKIWKRRGWRIAGVAVGCLFAAMMSVSLSKHVPAEIQGYVYPKGTKVSEQELKASHNGEENEAANDLPETKEDSEFGSASKEQIEDTSAPLQTGFAEFAQPEPKLDEAPAAPESPAILDQSADQVSNAPLHQGTILPEEVTVLLQDEDQTNTWIEPALPTPEPDQNHPMELVEDLPAALSQEQVPQEQVIEQPAEPAYIEPTYVEPEPVEPIYIEPVYIGPDEPLNFSEF